VELRRENIKVRVYLEFEKEETLCYMTWELSPRKGYREKGADRKTTSERKGKTRYTTRIQNGSWDSKFDGYVFFFSFVLSKLIFIHGVDS